MLLSLGACITFLRLCHNLSFCLVFVFQHSVHPNVCTMIRVEILKGEFIWTRGILWPSSCVITHNRFCCCFMCSCVRMHAYFHVSRLSDFFLFSPGCGIRTLLRKISHNELVDLSSRPLSVSSVVTCQSTSNFRSPYSLSPWNVETSFDSLPVYIHVRAIRSMDFKFPFIFAYVSRSM